MNLPPVLATLLVTAPLFAAASGSPTAIDGAGNIWQTGQTTSIATTADAFQSTAVSTVCGTEDLTPFQPPDTVYCQHAYLTKRDPSGKVLYATYLGGKQQDGGSVLTTDSQGNVYVAGYTYSADFPVTPGVFQSRNAGPLAATTGGPIVEPFGPIYALPGGDVFVAKFASDGRLLFSTFLGGSGSDVPTLIAVDPSGTIYVAGATLSSDFPLTANAMSRQRAASFFARLSADGTALTYSTYSSNPILAFDVDSGGRAYLTGNVASGNAVPPPGAAPYLTVIDTTAGTVMNSPALAKIAGAGVSLAIGAQELFLAISPAPPPYNFFNYPSTILRSSEEGSLGDSALIELPLDASRILSQTSLLQAEFDSILLDASGNAYAFGNGRGALPATATALLDRSCSENATSFVIEVNPAGTVVAATYFRQGNDSVVTVTAPGHVLLYGIATSTTIAIDLTTRPAALFGCPMNLAANTIGPGLAPGEIILLTGTGLGPTQGMAGAPDASGLYPTSLGGVQVLIGSVPAPLLYVQAGEIHAVAPFSVAGVSTIQVRNGTQDLLPLDVFTSTINPGIFSVNGQAAAINPDGSVNTPANPAPLGSIVSIYCTGTGRLQSPVTDGSLTPIPPPYNLTQLADPFFTFAGVNGTTVWSGAAPGLIEGVTQINVRLPAALPAGTNLGAVPVVLNTGALLSPPASISVK